MSCFRILHADDDPDDRLLFAEACQEAGVSIDIDGVENGRVLLERLRAATSGQVPPVDLVLMDCNMPLFGGRAVLEALESDPQLKIAPIVMFSTSADESDRCFAHEHGAAAYFMKPPSFFRLVQLATELAAYLNGQGPLPGGFEARP